MSQEWGVLAPGSIGYRSPETAIAPVDAAVDEDDRQAGSRGLCSSIFRHKGFIGLAASIGLSLGAVGASAAFADQCPKEESPIATDRPDVTNSSVVLPQRSFQNENGLNFIQRNGGHELDGTETRLRWGIAPCLEILADIPSYFAAVDGPLNSGFTNMTPAIKWQISPIPGKVDLSATVGAGIPTGTKAIAGPGAQPYVQFPWSWDLGGGWGISGMFTTFIVPADLTNKLSTESTFALEHEVAERAFLFIEYVGDYHVHGGPSYLLNSGGGYRITPTQQINFHIGVGLNNNAPAYIFGIGYSFRLDGVF